MKYSVIDVSSNSVSLIIADVDGRSPQNAEIIFKQRENLSLLSYLDGANLSPRGAEKLVDAITAAKTVSKNMGVKRVYLIATAVMRGIANAEEIEGVLLEKTGMRINYIDGETEAYCDYIANACYTAIDGAVLVDIGGKSIEVCDLAKKQREDMLCLDFGVLDLREKFVKKIQPDEGEGDDIKKYVKQKFNDAGLPKDGVYGTIVLAGPVCAAVYEVYGEFAGAQPGDGEMVIERKTFKKLVEFLLTDPNRSGLILKTAPEKLALIAPAAVVLRNLFKRFDVTNIIVSDKGVKEGYLKLVLSGEEGACFEFESAAAKPKEEPAPKKRRARKPAAKRAKPAQKPVEDQAETPDEAEEAGQEVMAQIAERQAAEADAAEEQPEAALNEEAAEEPMEETAEEVTEETTEEQPEEVTEEQTEEQTEE